METMVRRDVTVMAMLATGWQSDLLTLHWRSSENKKKCQDNREGKAKQSMHRGTDATAF